MCPDVTNYIDRERDVDLSALAGHSSFVLNFEHRSYAEVVDDHRFGGGAEVAGCSKPQYLHMTHLLSGLEGEACRCFWRSSRGGPLLPYRERSDISSSVQMESCEVALVVDCWR
jgi:hypothetical protein